jgi:hypothetical protein
MTTPRGSAARPGPSRSATWQTPSPRAAHPAPPPHIQSRCLTETATAIKKTRTAQSSNRLRLSATVPPKFFPLNVTMQPRQQDSIPYIHSSRNRSPYTFPYISLYSLKNHFHITNFNQLQFSFSLIIFHPSDVLRMYSKIKFIKNNYFTITTTKNI